jgi:hypothetical protein
MDLETKLRHKLLKPYSRIVNALTLVLLYLETRMNGAY